MSCVCKSHFTFKFTLCERFTWAFESLLQCSMPWPLCMALAYYVFCVIARSQLLYFLLGNNVWFVRLGNSDTSLRFFMFRNITNDANDSIKSLLFNTLGEEHTVRARARFVRSSTFQVVYYGTNQRQCDGPSRYLNGWTAERSKAPDTFAILHKPHAEDSTLLRKYHTTLWSSWAYLCLCVFLLCIRRSVARRRCWFRARRRHRWA